MVFAAAKTPDHKEMSDGVFMGCPVLAAAGKYEACLAHLRDVQALCLREDGIYRHSPLHEAAWGRGNGFPALGLAWALDYIPEAFAGREEILTSLQDHLEALAKHQDDEGMWHQVIDHPESYAEFSATCMITYAMLHGIREGWLDRSVYEPVVDRAWNAIKARIALDGESLTNVCESTGKQKSLEAYFQRRAINGRDERGGAMALMVSTERAFWEQER
ncbi:MAG: glycoside hydrolase family 88 protein [Verrucomicrobiota bacterium]